MVHLGSSNAGQDLLKICNGNIPDLRRENGSAMPWSYIREWQRRQTTLDLLKLGTVESMVESPGIAGTLLNKPTETQCFGFPVQDLFQTAALSSTHPKELVSSVNVFSHPIKAPTLRNEWLVPIGLPRSASSSMAWMA